MNIGIFCGSYPGRDPIYVQSAITTGQLLAERGIGIVYGGGRVGLMGTVADATMAAGGKVYGVIPKALADKEVEHRGLTELHIVETMHQRKLMMADLSDGFIALPGGAGTFEEIFEQWTWAQLGIHHKPNAFLNINGYYDDMRRMIDRMAVDGFIREEYVETLYFSTDIGEIVDRFVAYAPPPPKWSHGQTPPA